MNTLISERLGEVRSELTTWFMSLDYRNAGGGDPAGAQYAMTSVGLSFCTESELTIGPDFGY